MIEHIVADSSHLHEVITTVLAEVKFSVELATLRGSSEWRQGKGLVPSQSDLNLVDDASGCEAPNLTFAVWLTYLLMSIVQSKPEQMTESRTVVLARMLDTWATALQSPFVALTLLAARMLASLVQA